MPITTLFHLHVFTVHQQYQNTFFINPTDAHNYKITGLLKQLTIIVVLAKHEIAP